MPINEIPLPAITEEAQQRDKEILWSTSDFVPKGGTVVAGAGVLASGTVLGRVTASGKYAAYNNTNINGTEVAVGVLWGAVDASGTKDVPCNIIVSGKLKTDQLVGMDAAALTDLNARTDTVLNVTIIP